MHAPRLLAPSARACPHPGRCRRRPGRYLGCSWARIAGVAVRGGSLPVESWAKAWPGDACELPKSRPRDSRRRFQPGWWARAACARRPRRRRAEQRSRRVTGRVRAHVGRGRGRGRRGRRCRAGRSCRGGRAGRTRRRRRCPALSESALRASQYHNLRRRISISGPGTACPWGPPRVGVADSACACLSPPGLSPPGPLAWA